MPIGFLHTSPYLTAQLNIACSHIIKGIEPLIKICVMRDDLNNSNGVGGPQSHFNIIQLSLNVKIQKLTTGM